MFSAGDARGGCSASDLFKRQGRLGFRKLREFGAYHFMEWSPESSA